MSSNLTLINIRESGVKFFSRRLNWCCSQLFHKKMSIGELVKMSIYLNCEVNDCQLISESLKSPVIKNLSYLETNGTMKDVTLIDNCETLQ